MIKTSNLRVREVRPLISPAILNEELPVTDLAAHTVERTREQVCQVLAGTDDRLLVVVGPCSIHDPNAALEYAEKLKSAAERHADELLVVMRVYFEKPRTTVGWKGLINDPHLDESFDINTGLRTARRLLRQLNELGVPCGCEFLDPISPQFISGLVSWGAIGARTTESQVHRELASGLSMPIGFKNGTDGTIQIAVDAVLSCARPHNFLGVTEQGLAGVVSTTGNPECHVILRGGNTGTNYDAASVERVANELEKAGLRRIVMVDCSHGNSNKDYRRQPVVAAALADQLAAGQRALIGVMLESHLVEGNQKHVQGKGLVYGQSITDACMSWGTTEPVLEQLARGVQQRRVAPTQRLRAAQ
jgi:3-deoxy-7-phosphoheptulonate synthase